MWYLEQQLSSAPFIIPHHMQGWLTDPGSLVKRLQTFGAEQPAITILQESWSEPMADECEQLNIPEKHLSWIREVLIGEKGQAYLFARTIFPKETLTGDESELAHLGARTLGSVLFQNPALKRSPFEIALFQPQQAWHAHVTQHYPADSPLWARRSLFSLKQKNMLVTEVFLPALDALQPPCERT